MITKRHTLNAILSQTFNKEFLSGVNVSEFYQTSIIIQLLNFHREFQTMRKPLLKFFKWQDVIPYQYFTGGVQNLGTLPTKYDSFIEIIHNMYCFLELFLYKFDIKNLSETNIKLFDMFFKDMYISYVSDIDELVKTIKCVVRLQSVIKLFDKMINAFKYNEAFNSFIDEQIDNKKIEIEYFSNITHLDVKKLSFLDFPMKLIHRESEYKNAVLKLTPSLIKIIKSLI